MRNIQVFSWVPTAGATPLTWANCGGDPVAEADRIAAASNGRVEALFLFNALTQASTWAEPLPAIVQRASLNASEQQQWSSAFNARLKPHAKVSRVVIDCEASISAWVLSPEQWASVLDDPAVRARLPASLQGFKPADFTGLNRAAITGWNEYAAAMLNRAVYECVLRPARDAFGRDVLVSQYDALPPGLVDQNGWPYPSTHAGNVYSPVCYLQPGNLINSGGFKRPPIWNALVRDLNKIRASVRTGVSCLPWIAGPYYRGDGVPPVKDARYWTALVRHAAAAGVKEFLLWNSREGGDPNGEGEHDMQAVFSDTTPAKYRPSIPPIPYDAPTITTGKMRTRADEVG